MIKSLNETIYEIHQMIEFGNPDIAEEALKSYVYSIIDEVLEDPSMIYYDGAEAVYSYEAFDKFKKQIK